MKPLAGTDLQQIQIRVQVETTMSPRAQRSTSGLTRAETSKPKVPAAMMVSRLSTQLMKRRILLGSDR